MSMTVLERLRELLRAASTYNKHDLASPTVVIWPDGDRLWESAIGTIQKLVPELLVLRRETDGDGGGPATWLRYQLARRTFEQKPILYLPGVSRASFRSAASFPDDAIHLFALQYQGQFWTQANGKDWTPSAFLSTTNGGLGLEVAGDRDTLDALANQLNEVLQTRLVDLQTRKLAAADFHGLVARDPHRMLLQWLGEPEKVRKSWTPEQWVGFVTICRQKFGFDPEKDGVLVAAEKLAAGQGAWDEVWHRFVDAPTGYPGVRDALSRVSRTGLLDQGNERLPANNAEAEQDLQKSLLGTAGLNRAEALEALARLVSEHKDRALSVWARLDEAPLACAVAHLGALVDVVRGGAPGPDWAALAEFYSEKGWRADAAAWRSFDEVRHAQDVQAITAALRAVYLPWLEDLAARCGQIHSSYPTTGPATARTIPNQDGTAVVFVDGLRLDLARHLEQLIAATGYGVTFESGWSALPTVTATAKPAWRPFADHVSGANVSATFEPQVKDSGRPLRAPEFKGILEHCGLRFLESSSLGDQKGAVWTEVGAFDRYGHDDSSRLPWHINQELLVVCSRIVDLLKAGWQKVVVTTDHGWLYMPGGLPKTSLPAHLTESKWGRCAVPQPGAQHNLPQVPWFWGAEHHIVLAPGVSAFRAGTEYSHGGLTLQEALIATLTIDAGTAPKVATIGKVKWAGLRLQVAVGDAPAGASVDLRAKAADSASSVLSATQRSKSIGADGTVSITVEDDGMIGQAAILVVIHDGQVVAKQSVTIGED